MEKQKISQTKLWGGPTYSVFFFIDALTTKTTRKMVLMKPIKSWQPLKRETRKLMRISPDYRGEEKSELAEQHHTHTHTAGPPTPYAREFAGGR